MLARDYDYIETRLLDPLGNVTEAAGRLRQVGRDGLADQLMESAAAFVAECRAIRMEIYGQRGTSMIGTRITMTDVLAKQVGELAAVQPDTAVTVAYDDDYPECQWLVKFEKPYGSVTFVVNDQTGDYRVAGIGEGNKL